MYRISSGLAFGASLLLGTPALAEPVAGKPLTVVHYSDLDATHEEVARDPILVSKLASAGAKDRNGCSLPRLSIRTNNPLLLTPKVGNETAVDLAVVDNPWASGATSHWNAGMNRAVDHLFKPPQYVNVYATQTGDDLRGHYEGSNSPNETFAAFEVVIR